MSSKPLSIPPSRQAELGLCVLLAISDGDISDSEINSLSTKVGHLLGDDVPPIALAGAIDAEISAMATVGPERYIEQLATRVSAERKNAALENALCVALADGLADEELSMFFDVASAFGITQEAANTMFAEAKQKSCAE